MIDKSSVAESLQKLARQVKESDPRGSDRLVLLSNAVQTGANADTWSRHDIHTMIAPESIVELYRNVDNAHGLDRWIRYLEIFRNVLIFAPIMVTWYGISQATEKYNLLIYSAIQAKKLDLYSQPFLFLWQQRFGGTLPEYLTLSNIAIADVVIILLVVLCTFFAYALSNRSNITKDQDAQRLRANLFHAIAGASLSLSGQPQLTSGDNLEGVARQLEGMVRYSIGQLDTISKETANRLDKMAQDTTTRFETMAKDITRQFATSAQQTRTQLDGIVQQMNLQMQEGRKYLDNMGALTSGLVQTATQIQAASNALKTTNVALTTTIDKLVQPAQALSQQQDKLLKSVDESFKLLQSTSTAMNGVATNQGTMTKNLTQTLNTLKLVVENLEKSASAQASFANQYNTYLQRLNDDHDKQEKLATLMSDSTVQVKNALDEMKQAGVSLRSMAVSMNDLLHLQASVQTHPNLSGVMDIAAVVREAAQAMRGGGSSIKSSADELQQASRKLKTILDNNQNGHI